MDARLILAGQQPDFVGTIARANQAAAQQNEFGRQNALAQLFQDQGAQIMAGDQNALNALARFDPDAALGVQSTRQGMAFDQRQLEVLNAQERRAAEEYARGLSAAEAQAQAAKIEEGVKMGLAAQSPEEWDTLMARVSPDMVGMYDQRQMLANRFVGIADILKGQQPADPTKGAPSGFMWNDPNDPRKGVARLPGYEEKPADDYQRYVAEEQAAGRQPLTRLEFVQANKGKGITQTITNPDGSVTTLTIGGGQTGTGEPTVGQVYNPNEVQGVLDMISAIRNDPNLGRVTGPIEGGGGNNIDDLSAAQRAYYGAGGTALIERVGQLQSNAWLSARAMLKGGGAITDYESRKAEAAVARLSRAKGEQEFLSALSDLESSIREGMAKLQKVQGQAPAQPAQGGAPDFSQMSDEELDAFIAGGAQ